MDLSELRVQLDEIDKEIVRVYEDRMDLCRQVGEYKLETGKRILDKEREKQKIKAVSDLAHNEFNRTGISELFEQMMAISRKLQYQIINEKGGHGNLPFFGVDALDTDKIRVVFQGADGAYSQAAMYTYFGEDIDSFHVETCVLLVKTSEGAV